MEYLILLPTSINTPEIFIAVPEQDKFNFIKTLVQNISIDGAEINDLDGLRVSIDFGWGIIRASNTTPNLMLRFEANNEQNLQEIKTLFRNEITRILPQLSIPF